jgi:hypothetical protein
MRTQDESRIQEEAMKTRTRERTDGLLVTAQRLYRVAVRQPNGSDLSANEAVAVAKDYAPGRAAWHVASIERRNYDHVVVTLCR